MFGQGCTVRYNFRKGKPVTSPSLSIRFAFANEGSLQAHYELIES